MRATWLDSERKARLTGGVTAVAERLVIVMLPLVLAAAAVVVSMRPGYVQRAYRALPPDPHGFSAEERLDLALLTLAFLHHPAQPQAAVTLLKRLTLPGTDAPLYGARELSHLVDVKRLTDAVRAWSVGLGLLLAVCLTWLLARGETQARGWLALARGAHRSLRLLLGTGLLVVLFWPVFFVAFHQLLFPPGSWTFAGDAALIRLFPEAFWSGYAVSLLGGLLAAAAGLDLLGTTLARRVTAVSQAPLPEAIPAPLGSGPENQADNTALVDIRPRGKGGWL